MKLQVYTDGGSRGNPGDAGIGVHIIDEHSNDIEKRYKYLGIKTNNEAEYTGALLGIQRAIELGATHIDLFMDSKLVICQLNGEWKVKDENLRTIYTQIVDMVKQSNVQLSYNWIRREDNKEADRLSNVAMDTKS